MDKFTIDRQSGQLIWIDVENGIVQRCYNESEKFIAKMEENYKGKSISFLKTDFEKRMEGTYHKVRSQDIVDAQHKVTAIESRIKVNWNIISSITTPESAKPELKKAIDKLEVELSQARSNLADTRERIKTEHQYNFNL